ncbi:TPA: hypothetical protein DEG21_05120 [Patescibacteria group bacterium]|nr:hypothetical protein [Candidatus Gracilibacteria bacterium]HBY75211.1 hypothetical protein [Candidatus Gracilibacteria bacterium]
MLSFNLINSLQLSDLIIATTFFQFKYSKCAGNSQDNASLIYWIDWAFCFNHCNPIIGIKLLVSLFL